MLITNTPNNELHIYNNEGEEIVSIDDSGVTKPSGGNTTVFHADAVYPDDIDNGVMSSVLGTFDTEEEAFAAYDAMKPNLSHFGVLLDEETTIDDQYALAQYFALWAQSKVVFHFYAFMVSELPTTSHTISDIYLSGRDDFFFQGGFEIGLNAEGKYELTFGADIRIRMGNDTN